MPPGSADEISGDGKIYFHICVTAMIIIYGNKYSPVCNERQNVVLIQQKQVQMVQEHSLLSIIQGVSWKV